MVVHHDAVLRGEPGRCRECVVRHDAGADHDQVGVDRVAALTVSTANAAVGPRVHLR